MQQLLLPGLVRGITITGTVIHIHTGGDDVAGPAGTASVLAELHLTCTHVCNGCLRQRRSIGHGRVQNVTLAAIVATLATATGTFTWSKEFHHHRHLARRLLRRRLPPWVVQVQDVLCFRDREKRLYSRAV